MAPVLAAVSYGSVFRSGFFNFYLSLGLCFLGYFRRRGKKSKWSLIVLPLIPLALIAHPFAGDFGRLRLVSWPFSQ